MFIARVNEGPCRVTRRSAASAVSDMDGEVPVNLKKVLVLAAVALVLFLLITRPEESAGAVQTVLGWLRDGAESIITFIRSLFGTAAPIS